MSIYRRPGEGRGPGITNRGRRNGSPAKGRRRGRGYGHRSTKATKPTKPIITLERLPTEILQEILILSGNVNLPRSSPTLASALTDEYTYLQFCGPIFEKLPWSGWSQYSWNKRKSSSTRTLEHQAASEALELRWMTPARYREWVRPVEALSLSLKGVTLPAKCLKRSASDETIEWLKDLICDGAGIDEDVWRSTFLGEDVEYMWGEAVRRRDSELLVALMSDAVGMKPLTKHLRWAVEESSCDLSLIRTLMEFHRCRGETTEWPLSDPILAAMLSENVPTEEIQQGLQNVPRRVILLHTKDIHTVYRANLTTKKPCFCIRETMPNGQRTARWRVMTEELRMRLARKYVTWT